jgi:hypothetical protein
MIYYIGDKHCSFWFIPLPIREGFLLSSENIDEMSIKFTNKFIEFVKMYANADFMKGSTHETGVNKR